MRLIDADKLIKKNNEDMYFNNDFMSCAVLSAFNKMLMNEPEINVIDVESVSCGKWECVNEVENVYIASCCGREVICLGGTPSENEWIYCPYCGAKMDGGNENA